MIQKEKKKHSHSDHLRYMRMIEEGVSVRSVSVQTGIDHHQLSNLWSRYRLYGASALKDSGKKEIDDALREAIVLDIEKNCITLQSASLKYGISYGSVRKWMKLFRTGGLPALMGTGMRGGRSDMGRPRKNSRPLTELERLQKENQELKTEIALLKKVRALVEERNARLRGTGRGPSRD